MAKKELEDLKGELINKEREVEDLKENHIMTINLYKQRFLAVFYGETYAVLELGPVSGAEKGRWSDFEIERRRPSD